MRVRELPAFVALPRELGGDFAVGRPLRRVGSLLSFLSQDVSCAELVLLASRLRPQMLFDPPRRLKGFRFHVGYGRRQG